MRKIAKLLPLFLVTMLCLAATACDDDDDKPISSEELPAAAKSFVTTYFPSAQIVTSQKDNDDYEVMLSDGTRIDFDLSGEWTDVDAPVGQTLPTGYYPEAIDTYIAANMNGAGINEISKERGGYDVELVTGADLLFSYAGEFLGFDLD